MSGGYDPKCGDLAEYFLECEPHLNTVTTVAELAQQIQDLIEDFISQQQDNYDTDDDSTEARLDARDRADACNGER